MKTAEEIVEILKEHKEELERRYGVKEIGIFGSYVRKEAKEESDVDILVEFSDYAELDLFKLVELREFLRELIGVTVDLVLKSGLKPGIGKQILREVVYV